MPLRLSLSRSFAVVVVACVAIWLTLSVGVSSIARYRNSGLALAWAPFDARALGDSSAQALQPAMSPDNVAEARALAQRALRRDPTVIPAVTTLGVIAQGEGNTERAEKLFTYAAGLSRRNLATNLWMIEHHVEKDDIAGALQYFDMALRTSREAQSILFPILMGAMEDPRLIKPIADILAPAPKWRQPFMYQMIREGKFNANMARLVMMIGNQDEVPWSLKRLVGEKEYALAWAVYSNATGIRVKGLRDGRFAREALFAPFDWNLASSGDGSAYRLDGPMGGLAFEVEGTGRLDLATQLVALSPGAYRIRTLRGPTQGALADLPAWTISCAGNETPVVIDSVDMAPKPDQSEATGAFTIPGQGCDWQWLRLRTANRARSAGVNGTIQSVAIERRN